MHAPFLFLFLITSCACFDLLKSLQFASLSSITETISQFVAPSNNIVSFDGHQVWRIYWESEKSYSQFNAILQKQVNLVDVWMINSLDKYMDIQIAPTTTPAVLSILKSLGLTGQVFISDLQPLLNRQLVQPPAAISTIRKETHFHEAYHTFDEINQYLKGLQTNYQTLREIMGISIGKKQDTIKRQIIFNSGTHAREWIGPASILYIANQLTSRYGIDPRITKVVDYFDWVIIPVLNADGFVYTHSTNRMWRKTRQPNSMPYCVGTDPNRNWGYKFGESGASSNPCSEAYHGPSAFSSPEARAMSEFLANRTGLVDIYADIHAYSQLWMYPYGADCNEKPPHVKDIDAIAKAGAAALKKVHGTNFKVGGICKIIYQASGSSVDWAIKYANVTFPFALELRDTGRYGFMLPPDQIIPSGEELLAGFLEMAEKVMEL